MVQDWRFFLKKVLFISLLVIAILSFIIPLAFGDEILISMLPKTENQEGITIINTIKNGSINDINNLICSDVKKVMPSEAIIELKEYLNENDVRDYELFNSNINISGDAKIVRLIFQAKLLDDKWALINMELHKENNVDKLYGINIQPMEKSLQETNNLTIVDRPIINCIVLVLGIAFACLNFYAFYLVLNLKIRKKWLWAIISFTGICTFAFNWSTGEYSFNPVAIGFPCFSYSKMGSYSPLIVALYFPIGSLLFLGLKWRLINHTANNEQSAVISDSEEQTAQKDTEEVIETETELSDSITDSEINS